MTSPSTPTPAAGLTLQVYRPRLTLPKIKHIVQALQSYSASLSLDDPEYLAVQRTYVDLTSFYLGIVEGSSKGSPATAATPATPAPTTLSFQEEMAKLTSEFKSTSSSTASTSSADININDLK
jgi:hypothetical protein